MIRNADVYAGEQLRKRRIELGLSQTYVGEALGVSFQQVQKYEKAVNRMTSGVLHTLCEALTVPPEYFFCDPPMCVEKRRGERRKSDRRISR